MCGINGGLRLTHADTAEMNKALAHRGPDGSGVYVDDTVALGHTRLAILDTSEAGAQPMHYCKRIGMLRAGDPYATDSAAEVIVTFNGEIYNYLELRSELEANGYAFNTETDTEVVLAAYVAWGKDCIQKFNGMWALCIYDREAQELFLSRDRLGVKPLYYYKTDTEFLFSSEIKGLFASRPDIRHRQNINTEAVELYFSLGYIPAPHTIYQHVYQLPAAHAMVVDVATGKNRLYRYWELPDYAPVHDKRLLISEGKELLYNATSLRMRADVPVGAFLSGGLDSTSVVAAMRKYTSLDKLHTFSIGFDGRYDESEYIEKARGAFGTIHHHRYFTKEDFKEQLGIFAAIFDEPMSDHSGFPTQMVSGMARQHVTVVLSGDGGDEVFGGYASHILGARLDLLRRLPRSIRQLIALLPVSTTGGKLSLRSFVVACRLTLGAPEDLVAEASFGDTLRTHTAKEWLQHAFAASYAKSGNSFAEALRIFDVLYNTLPHKYLTKVDRASMHHSLEVRSPFLDYRLYEYAQTIPTKWKVNIKKAKLLLGEIVRGEVPEAIIARKKQGFEPPIYEWLQDPENEPMLQEAVATLSILAPEVADWYKKHNQLYTVDPKHLFRLYSFQLWWQHWVKNT